MLTAKQFELLRFIQMRLNDTGISPSFEEMKEALGLKSKSGIHRLISALEERGFLRRLPNRARALEIIKIPNAHEGYTAPNSNIEEVADRQTPYMPASPQMNASQYQDTDNINNLSDMNIAALQGKPRRSKRILNPSVHNSYSTNIIAANDDIMAIPLHGRIAAGVPIEALEGDQLLSVPAALLGPGEHFALEVAGDSMHEAGILDGDFALIRKAERAKNGDIVVALVNNEEATLKYFYQEKQQIRLEPANSAYSAQIYDPKQICIQGQLAGILRSYH